MAVEKLENSRNFFFYYVAGHFEIKP